MGNSMDLSYLEKLDKLQIRIRAHKEFANFDVSNWIDDFCARSPRRSVLDVGCGSGNHLGIYAGHVGASGRVVGIDRDRRLVEAALAAHGSAPQVEVVVGSMDEPLPFPDASFDLCFSNFAIYNAADPRATLAEIRRVLEPGGQVVLIGPTRNNAAEIYEFNQRLTGVAIDPITLIRTDRLRQEILPLARELFVDVTEEVLHSRLTFPSADEFLLYFQSTMVYEETAEKAGLTREQMLAAIPAGSQPVVSKEMLAVVGTRV
jgi:ubiquinone/menaquinone biosynthesis C-methylase UbiE